MPFQRPKFPGGHVPGAPYGNVLSLYREGPWAPSRLKGQGPLMGPSTSLQLGHF